MSFSTWAVVVVEEVSVTLSSVFSTAFTGSASLGDFVSVSTVSTDAAASADVDVVVVVAVAVDPASDASVGCLAPPSVISTFLSVGEFSGDDELS